MSETGEPLSRRAMRRTGSAQGLPDGLPADTVDGVGAGVARGARLDAGAAFPDARPQRPALVTMPGMVPSGATDLPEVPGRGGVNPSARYPATGEWHTAGGRPAPAVPPAVARLYPGSRPIPVVHPSPHTPSMDDGGRSLDVGSPAYPGSRALPMPIQAPPPIAAPRPPTGDGRRVAGPRVNGPRSGVHSVVNPEGSNPSGGSPVTSGATVLDPGSFPVSRPIPAPVLPPIQAAAPPAPRPSGASGWSRRTGPGPGSADGGAVSTRSALRAGQAPSFPADGVPAGDLGVSGTRGLPGSRAELRRSTYAAGLPAVPDTPGARDASPRTGTRAAVRGHSDPSVLPGGDFPRRRTASVEVPPSAGRVEVDPQGRATGIQPAVRGTVAPTSASPGVGRSAPLATPRGAPADTAGTDIAPRARRVVQPGSSAIPIPAGPGVGIEAQPGASRPPTARFTPEMPAFGAPPGTGAPRPRRPVLSHPVSPATGSAMPRYYPPVPQGAAPPQPAPQPALQPSTPRLAPFTAPSPAGSVGVGTPMPGLDSGRLADAGSARGRSPEDSFDPASVSHPGTGSIRVWTGSINAIRAPIAREERPAPVFSEPASPASGYDRPSAHATEPDQVLGRPGALEFDYPPPGVSDGLGHVADRPEPVALEPFGIAPAVPSFAPAEPVQPFAAQPAQPPLFDPGLAEEFAGLLGQAPPGGPLEFLGEEEQPAMPPWETSGWLTDASYAPDPGSTTLQASFRPIDGGGVVADAPEMAPSDADDDETDTEFAGPPPFLPDGRPPWMEGPDARRIPPRGRQGRWVLQAILWVVAGIALGAAIWAATALLGDAGIFASGPGSGGAVEIAGEAGGG